MVAESVEEVRAHLEKDIYTTSGVWDMEKVGYCSRNRLHEKPGINAFYASRFRYGL